MLSWHYVTRAAYDSASAADKTSDKLFFLSDTHEIYRGAVPFTESVVIYTDLPTEGIALNKLYINSDTLEGKIYNGLKWITVIKPVTDTITINGMEPVSGKAVSSYVIEAVKEHAPKKGIDYYTEDDKNEIIVDIINELNRSSIELPETLSVNTIYDLGEQEDLSINLPSGKLGDFIEVDFLSTQTPTTLTITANSGMSDYDLIPNANTIYSLYFNWIRLDAETYGWGFGYAEYTRTVAK